MAFRVFRTRLQRLSKQLLACVAEATNKVGPRLQDLKASISDSTPWSIGGYGLLEWASPTNEWFSERIDSFQLPDTFSYPQICPKHVNVTRF